MDAGLANPTAEDRVLVITCTFDAHGGFGAIEMFGPVIDLLAAGHQVIGVDLQGHGRTLPFDRPMALEAMGDDIAALIRHLGYQKADIIGYSTGGGVALRAGIQRPEVVDRMVLVSTPYSFSGWHDFNQQGMKQIAAAPEQVAEGMRQTPMYQMYAAIAPDANNWGKLVSQMGAMVDADYDWSAEVAALQVPTMLVVGDWDSVRASHAVQFFELLGGGRQDANWDGSGTNFNRFAILPGLTHYTIFRNPKLAEAAIGFLDAPAN